ncbi:hypothetical protein ACFL17_02120, partial [Pseudomonadota bacterium]
MNKDTFRNYWTFYWPLALTGVAMLMSRQFQNATLARFPDPAEELAVYALASSTFMLFNAMMIFVPQMANVLVRSVSSRQVCFRFILMASAVLCLPLLVLGFTDLGEYLLGIIFGIEGEYRATVSEYLRYLFPLVIINGVRQFFIGLLVQAKYTGLVTVLNVFFLCAIVALLLTGLSLEWDPVFTVAVSHVVAAGLQMGLCYLFYLIRYSVPEEQETQPLTYRRAFEFFWPVATTSGLFAFGRPIIYSVVGRLPESFIIIAALRVGFDFAMMFHNPLNQLRHFIVTYGRGDLKSVRQFMFTVMVVMSGVMLLVAATPLSEWMIRDLLGVRGAALPMAHQVLWVMCLVPFVVTLRNYFHGLALI